METFAKGWLAQETHNHMDRPRQRQKDKKGILTEDKPFQTETDQETKSVEIENIVSKSKWAETHWHISGCILHISLLPWRQASVLLEIQPRES